MTSNPIGGKKKYPWKIPSNPHGNNTTCNSGNATIVMMTPFFERPSSVIERTKKSMDGFHSVPEPISNQFLDGKRIKWSETPTKKYVKQY